MNLKTFLAKNYINLRGWKTDRKIVVIESDDWGSIRMKSKDVYLKLLERGVPVDKSYFTRNDAVETNEDIWELKEVLAKFTDKNKRHPIITFNTVLANPDYKKIIDSGYQQYFFKGISESYIENELDSSKVLSIYHESIKNNQYIKPQFHGREHLNVRKLMNNFSLKMKFDLLGSEYNCLLGLNEGVQEMSREFYNNQKYMAGFETLDEDHKKEIDAITRHGLQMFEQLFGIQSKSFVAQSLIWGDHLLPVLHQKGVKYIQGAQQFIPLGEGKLKVVNNFSGAHTAFDQLLWRRNASFEPSANPTVNWAEKCMTEIKIAFKWRAPAIINSHRVNYIGSINKANRENGLNQLNSLLTLIVKKWPDVEFFSSDELGDIMSK